MAEILIGVSAGVSAYKTASLVSRLAQDGHGVSVVMTPTAEKFVGRATFSALSGRRVVADSFDMQDHPLGPHIELARQADLVCVAPVTADLLAKLAQGHADDLLTTMLLAFEGPLLLAPAMNREMWAKPAVQRNLKTVSEDGAHVIQPGTGWQSCREVGTGRMAEAEEIHSAIDSILKAATTDP